jgi:hypothetical protein
MPRQKVKVRVRVADRQKRRGFSIRQFIRRWGYFLLMAIACVATVIGLWIIISRMRPPLPPPPE